MKLLARCAVLVAFGVMACGAGFSQKPAQAAITLDQVRQFDRLVGMHDLILKTLNEQLKLRRDESPTWWPKDVFDDVEKRVLAVDEDAIAYPFLTPCATEADGRLLVDLFQTPEGTLLVKHMFGVSTKAEPASATGGASSKAQHAAPDQTRGAFKRLDASDQRHAQIFFGTSHGREAIHCMDIGFMQASQIVSDRRSAVAQRAIAEHQDEILQAKVAYDAQQANAPKQ